MKDVLSNANFPMSNGKTYHVNTAAGQVANRIVTVGDTVRARRIAECFDGGKILFEHLSQRNFLTLTGLYNGVPLSVIAVGMGMDSVDFLVRECRAVIEGEMIIVRLGSCGSINQDYKVGTVVVPKTCIAVSRNYDYFHPQTTEEERANMQPYIATKPLDSDQEVHDQIARALEANKPKPDAAFFNGESPKAAPGVWNCSADHFYGSQGRIDPSFYDANETLIDDLQKRYPELSTLEMETFVIKSLAASANEAIDRSVAAGRTPPQKGRIRVGALQMIFAQRLTSDFITPEECHRLELWAGRSVLEALSAIHIPLERLHPEGVWGNSTA